MTLYKMRRRNGICQAELYGLHQILIDLRREVNSLEGRLDANQALDTDLKDLEEQHWITQLDFKIHIGDQEKQLKTMKQELAAVRVEKKEGPKVEKT